MGRVRMFSPTQFHSEVWISHSFICQTCLQLVRKRPHQGYRISDQFTRERKHISAKPAVRTIGSRLNRQSVRVQQFRSNSGQAADPIFEDANSGSILLQRSSPSISISQPVATLTDVISSSSSSSSSSLTSTTNSSNAWELTVGIEIHAELNTTRKLFSQASTVAVPATATAAVHPPVPTPTPFSTHESGYANANTHVKPNTRVAHFDVALPGAQPQFQKETVIPAIRAALALGCEIQAKSSFDRKHYFYHDQPCGYQITQFYEPFAKNGKIVLYAADGIAPEDRPSVQIDIEKIQMEQDTAKSVQYNETQHLIDYNRASHPLIEIITAPQIRHPATAAALVRKIQASLKAVDAVTAGMEMGGLRADVNVSVRERKKTNSAATAGVQIQEPGEVGSLGQRTEIKNLSSFKAVHDAIVAERARQIAILSTGGKVVGETRAWTLGEKESRKLRTKEGEVDYRYMPDADLGPVAISRELIDRMKETLPLLPDQLVEILLDKQTYGIPEKDAMILVSSGDGDMLDYYMDVVYLLKQALSTEDVKIQKIAKIVGNWTLHELGGLLGSASLSWNLNPVSSHNLVSILLMLLRKEITGPSAKHILATVFREQGQSVRDIVKSGNLVLQPFSRNHYVQLAEAVIRQNESVAEAAKAKNGNRKIMFLVGQMIREGGTGRIEPQKAKAILEEILAVKC